jgi:hypothetical protein
MMHSDLYTSSANGVVQVHDQQTVKFVFDLMHASVGPLRSTARHHGWHMMVLHYQLLFLDHI